jgi:DMSO/TMAO reductase YedYZ molybdopterin-dependent catalytic subunit
LLGFSRSCAGVFTRAALGDAAQRLVGLLSYAAYKPRLGSDPNRDHGLFGFYLFNWVTSPSWFYRVTEGIHVMPGLALVRVVLAKLWSVIPKLSVWPPWRSVASLLERPSLVLVVGGVIIEMTTGILNIEYTNPISFYTGHFYGAWAFMAGFVIHICVKLGEMVCAAFEAVPDGAADRARRHRARGGGRRPRRDRARCADDLPARHARARCRHVTDGVRAYRR